MTVLSLIERASAHLAERSFDEARIHTELMLAHVLGLRRLDLYLQFDRPLTEDELAAFRTLYQRRLAHEPLQYILGETEFMGMRIAVDRRALIPRPETEELVEAAVTTLRGEGEGGGAVLDIGSGSGNIAVALGRMLPHKFIVSIDVSGDAIALAAHNVSCHELPNVALLQGDIGAGMPFGETFEAVVANPPYVPREEYETLAAEVKDHEPRSAVTDDGDGMRVIGRIIDIVPNILHPGGYLFMEIGHGQAERVLQYATVGGLQDAVVLNDVAGIPRILKGRRSR
jgi:release factor glutamine methyltransferase